MFDATFEMVEQYAETFRDGVRDAFGSSMIADVLDPIRKEIGMLHSFNEEFQRRSSSIEQVFQEARSLQLDEGAQG